jgi:very-short-patch-repair endonuclease
MAAVLCCGTGALLSHASAAALWEIRAQRAGPIHISIPGGSGLKVTGLRLHRRSGIRPTDRRTRRTIPVTSPVLTLVDLSPALSVARLEAAVNEADKLDLVDPERLRVALDEMRGMPGVAALRRVLDRRTFVLTDSQLERYFLPLVRRAGLSLPVTGRELNGFEVDFYWPDLGLVVETDGLRYHRTPAEQARDRLRDQTHAAAGLTPLRFTHAQIRFEGSHVCETLRRVARRLSPQTTL